MIENNRLCLHETNSGLYARTKYKTKLHKRYEFWQIEMTERAQELSVVIAPDGQIFRWNVMPFGLSNAPATIQELMNSIIAVLKRRPKVQALIMKGAVIEAYIVDVLLGTKTKADHMELIDEFLAVGDDCTTRAKLEKCEFMTEVVEYLGFEVGREWSRPVENKVAPLLKVQIGDHPVQGVRDVRAFIGSCNFCKKQSRNFTYSSVLLTNLTK